MWIPPSTALSRLYSASFAETHLLRQRDDFTSLLVGFLTKHNSSPKQDLYNIRLANQSFVHNKIKGGEMMLIKAALYCYMFWLKITSSHGISVFNQDAFKKALNSEVSCAVESMYVCSVFQLHRLNGGTSFFARKRKWVNKMALTRLRRNIAEIKVNDRTKEQV